MLSIKVVVLLFTVFMKGPDGSTHGVVIQPQAFQTVEDCEGVKSKLEKAGLEKDENVVAYRIQCVDNTMPIIGHAVAGGK